MALLGDDRRQPQLPVMLFLGVPPGMPHFERKSSIWAENRGYFKRHFPLDFPFS
jgi:hypothetical protein